MSIDLNECERDVCGKNAKCINEYGSFNCECLDGYYPKYGDHFSCEDLDECSNECYNDCDLSFAYCVNLNGTYECKCREGFYGDGKTDKCFDIDECKYLNLTINKCSSNSNCKNTFGSFECTCKSGFYGNGTYCEGFIYFMNIINT